MTFRFVLVSILSTAACVTDATDTPMDGVPELPLGGKADGMYAFYGVGSACGGGDCGFDLQTLNDTATSQVRGIEWPQLPTQTEEEVANNLFGARVVVLASTFDREEHDGSTAEWAKAYRVWVAANTGGFVAGTPSYTWLTRKRQFCFQEPCVVHYEQYVLNGPQLDSVTSVTLGTSVEPDVVAELEELLDNGEGILVLGEAQEIPGGNRFVVSRAYVPL